MEHTPGKIIFNSGALKCTAEIQLKIENKPEKILVNKKEIDFEFDEEQKQVTVNIEKGEQIDMEIFYTD